jgi:glutamate-1-semialdehyde 2,1-aminomutase
MVRFGKNGSDATAGAIRVARAFTGHDHVLVCGYHGWQDWYIGSTARNKGVPAATRALTHTFPYNDLAALDAKLAEFDGQVAAVILEPMNAMDPAPGFLAGVKDRTHKAGAILVFDEVVTGFRFARGGAQEVFGVTPDLTTLGKGMSNGFPLSAVCGRREIMKEMEEVFFSFTMGGETLSLAAAKTTIGKLLNEPVIETMRSQGTHLKAGLAKLIERHCLNGFMSVSGNPTWSFLLVEDSDCGSSWDINTFLIQELLARGIIALGTHTLSYAHAPEDVARLLSVYDETFSILSDAVRSGSVGSYLRCAPLKPLFRVR